MAKILDDVKVGSMLGETNQALSQVRPAVNQIEQWNALAGNVKEILQMIMSRTQQQQGVQQVQVPVQTMQQFQQTPVQTIQAPQPVQQNIVVDIPILKQKLIGMKNQLKTTIQPENQQMTVQQLLETSDEAFSNLIDMFSEKVAMEIKGCVKLQ